MFWFFNWLRRSKSHNRTVSYYGSWKKTRENSTVLRCPEKKSYKNYLHSTLIAPKLRLSTEKKILLPWKCQFSSKHRAMAWLRRSKSHNRTVSYYGSWKKTRENSTVLRCPEKKSYKNYLHSTLIAPKLRLSTEKKILLPWKCQFSSKHRAMASRGREMSLKNLNLPRPYNRSSAKWPTDGVALTLLLA